MLRRLFDRLRNRAADAGIAALIVGLVSELFGVDIAPAEVDAVVTAVAAALAIIGRWREQRGT